MADDRERGCGLLMALESTPEIELRVQRLVAGDYMVDGRLLIERKSLNDFLDSIADGRVFRQAKQLMAQELPCLLLLEGSSQDIAARHFSRPAIQGALLNLQLIWGLPILRSHHPEESVSLMLHAAGQLQRKILHSAFRFGHRPSGRQKAQTYLLQGLPGVGRGLALELLKHFGSPMAVFNATEGELRQVKGIGSKKAKRMRWVMEGNSKVPR